MTLFVGFILWFAGFQANVGPPKGFIQGSVVRAGSNERLPQATVILAPSGKGRTLTTAADEKGNFRFQNVDPGRYRLFAERDGFIKQEYGQKRINSPGTILVIRANQQLDEIVLPMFRVPTISGYVSDPVGEPLAAASAQAYTVRYTTSGRKLALIKTVLTDDQGEYRLFGLDPGSYYVSASYGDLSLRPGIIRLTPNLTNPDAGYTTMYYPSALSPIEATALHHGPGIDVNSVNIALKNLPRFDVSGRVTAVGVRSFDAQIAFVPASTDPRADLNYPIHTSAGGTFDIRGVSPGSYVILATADIDGRRLFSDAIRIDVGNEDVKDLALPLFKGVATLTGAVSLSSVISRQPQLPEARASADELSGLKLTLLRSDGKPGPKLSAITKDSSQFAMEDVPIAEYDVLLEPIPVGTYLSGIRVERGIATLSSLRLDPALRDRNVKMDVILNTSGSMIDGQVTDQRGEPVTAAQIVLVPEARFRNRPDRYLLALTDETGHFEISGVPPGGHTAFAFEEIEPGLYYDAQFMVRFADRGVIVNETTRTRRTVTLHLIPAEETRGGPR